MLFVLILSKLCVLMMYASIIINIFKFKKEDATVFFELDLLSRVEFMAGIGIALISVISVINEDTFYFSLALCILSIIIGFSHKRRLILAESKKVMLKGKLYSIKDIQKLSTGLFSLQIQFKKNPNKICIYVPLTSNYILKNKIESKLNR